MKFPLMSRRRALSIINSEVDRSVKAYEQGRLDQFLAQQAASRQYTLTGKTFSGVQQEIDEGYASVIWYYAAVNYRAQAAADIPLKLFKVGAKQDDEVYEGDAYKLLTVNPNPHFPLKSPRDVREFFTIMLLCTGNGYLYIPRSTQGTPMFIRNMLSQLMTPTATEDKDNPVIYKYFDSAKSAPIEYPKRDIIHWMLANPNDEIVGLSPIQVARYTIDTYNMGKIYNNSMLQNAGKPGGSLTFPALLTPEQRALVERDVKEKWEGPQNVGHVRVLEAGAKFENISLSPEDMAWLQSQKLSMREIAVMLGVPPELMGDSESKTYANAKEARIAFYEITVVPQITREVDLYNQFFYPKGDYYFAPDLSSVDALKKNETELLRVTNECDFFTPNEKRLRAGYDESPDPAMNKFYISAGKVPLDMFGGDLNEGGAGEG